jgi:hypothetical protein
MVARGEEVPIEELDAFARAAVADPIGQRALAVLEAADGPHKLLRAIELAGLLVAVEGSGPQALERAIDLGSSALRGATLEAGGQKRGAEA